MANKTEPSSGTLTLHHLSSSASFRILWAREELAPTGLKYDLKYYIRQTGRAPEEMKAIFPLGKAPICDGLDPWIGLVIEPPSSPPDQKPVVVVESRLILQYIADHYSNGIWAPSPADKIRSDYFQEFAGMTLLAKVDAVFYFDIIPAALPFFIRPFLGPLCNYVATVNKGGLVGSFELMEKELSDEKPWFNGERIGQADFLMSFGMDIAEKRGYFDGGMYPKLKGWVERIHERAAYKRALEKGGSYDLVWFDLRK